MRAVARIVAEADGRGGTRLAVLRGESPLSLFRTGPRLLPDDRAHRPRGSGRCGGVTIHLVGGAAGPLRGDDLRLELEVGPGARLDVRSAAAMLVLPGRPGLPPSRLEIRATVRAAATLRWQPEPLIAAAGSEHETVTVAEVAAGGTLIWRDDLVCGRFGEAPGDVRTDLTVRHAGATIHRHQLAIGPNAPGWSGAAVLGAARATGSAVIVGSGLPTAGPVGMDGAVVMPLVGGGLVATAVGADIRSVRAALDPICARAAAAPLDEPTAPTDEAAHGPAPGAHGPAPGAHGPAPGAHGPAPGARGPAPGEPTYEAASTNQAAPIDEAASTDEAEPAGQVTPRPDRQREPAEQR